MYHSRLEAASKLLEHLKSYKGAKNTLICAIPKGGVEIGALIAKALSLPLELICASKIGAPGAEDLPIGAITNFGQPVWLSQAEAFSEEEKTMAMESAKLEATEQFVLYYHNRTWPEFKGKTVIVVNEGTSSGARVESAIRYLKTQGVEKLILAAPVSPIDTKERLASMVDECVIPLTPVEFYAVGQFYQELPDLTDQQVLGWIQELLSHK
jgi:putative phosphoribosyl transferase